MAPLGNVHPFSGSHRTPPNAFVITLPLIGSAGCLAHQPMMLLRSPNCSKALYLAQGTGVGADAAIHGSGAMKP
jgi:hypothetical protein